MATTHEFVHNLRKLAEENFDQLVEKAVEEVKEQLEGRAKQGHDTHQVTLPSEKLTKSVANHFFKFDGLKVEFKGRSMTLSW